MKHKWLIVISTIILLPILFILVALGVIQKPFATIAVNGRTIATVHRSFLGPVLGESSTDIYSKKGKFFSLHQDFWDCPEFIYPFADGKRFLCDYWADTAWLDFVVDFGAANTNGTNSSNWPSDALDGQLRATLIRMATNIVFDTKGTVRLPNYEEVQEVSTYLISMTPNTTKAVYLDFFSFDMKKHLLLDLATNRESYYPAVNWNDLF